MVNIWLSKKKRCIYKKITLSISKMQQFHAITPWPLLFITCTVMFSPLRAETNQTLKSTLSLYTIIYYASYLPVALLYSTTIFVLGKQEVNHALGSLTWVKRDPSHCGHSSNSCILIFLYRDTAHVILMLVKQYTANAAVQGDMRWETLSHCVTLATF